MGGATGAFSRHHQPPWRRQRARERLTWPWPGFVSDQSFGSRFTFRSALSVNRFQRDRASPPAKLPNFVALQGVSLDLLCRTMPDRWALLKHIGQKCRFGGNGPLQACPIAGRMANGWACAARASRVDTRRNHVRDDRPGACLILSGERVARFILIPNHPLQACES